MGEITYKEIHEFGADDLKDLFLSVECSSGHFLKKLQIAMRNFQTVISAWHEDKLVGMICAMDDGIMTAYPISSRKATISRHGNWKRISFKS